MKNNKTLLALLLITTLTFTACASLPKTPAEEAEARSVNDPLESVNRVTFDVNDFLDRLLLKPLAKTYRFIFPEFVRNRVANILTNMGEPVIFANNLLQGRISDAGSTLGRFATNTTVGVGGMFEVANGWGLPRQSGDFGQTLHTWGINEGPYVVLPLFGPSNIRDAIGLGVDSVISPWQYIVAIGPSSIEDKYTISKLSATALSEREKNIEALDAIKQGSLDFYAQLRSVYRQHRAKELGVTSQSEPIEFEDYDATTTTMGLR
jgi:phospholipid-binding lipoprotein MlaA